MKTKNIYTGLWVSFFLLSVVLSHAYGSPFTMPQVGDRIGNRQDFPAAVDLKKYDSSGYYWVAIASVTSNANTWKETVKLYDQIYANNDKSKKQELIKRIKGWKPDLFWPKFYVPKNPYQSRVFDGGINPLTGLEPQPMILLIIKVDDNLNNYFKQWFRQGSEGRGYPGISASRLAGDMIIGRCEIFFP